MKRSRPHPTLSDVAKRAGVGKTTVSRVINGAHKVSPETLERINEVIRELGYQPSQAARSLKGESTKTVGLILPRMADPFFASCAEAAQAVARSHDYLLMVAATDYDPETEIDHVYTLLRHRVDGILIAPCNSWSKKLAAIVDEIGIPVVTFNDPLLKAHLQGVVVDNYGGARAATEHLIEHGYRRILCLGGDARLYSVRERQKGYADAVRKAGLKSRIEDSANDYSAVERVLRSECQRKKPVEAIFAVRNSITIYAFQACQASGLRVAKDVALAGFDDFELACTLRPAVTVVSQPVKELGSCAANLLFEQLQPNGANESSKKFKTSKLRTSLIVRSSCACNPSGFNPSGFNPSGFNPSGFNPDGFNPA